jgi:tRNA-modifying protein YgfZ
MDDSLGMLAVRQGAAFVDALPLDVIHGIGADRIAFLHRLLSGNVAGTAEGGGCHALLLNLKGHIVSDIQLLAGADYVRLMVAAGQGQPTSDTLNRYAIMDDFKATPEVGQRVLCVYGPRAADILAIAGATVPTTVAQGSVYAHGSLTFGGREGWVTKVTELGGTAFRIGLPKVAAALLSDALIKAGGVALSPAAVECLRVASGELKFGVETTIDRFPMELGLDDAIDYQKGCYLGQEPIVRIRDRGHVNWMVARLRFPADGPKVAVGDKLESDERPAAGHVTSVAYLPAIGSEPATGAALAMVHASLKTGSLRILTSAGVVSAEVLQLTH